MGNPNIFSLLLAGFVGAAASSVGATDAIYSPTPETLPPNAYAETNFPAEFRSVVAPRAAIDLAKGWEVAVVPSMLTGVTTNAKDRVSKNYRVEPLPAEPQWKPVDLPWSESRGQAASSSYARRKVKIPAELAGKAAVLRVGYVADTFSVAINGHETRYDKPLYGAPLAHDVTGLLKPGDNEIVFHFYFTDLDNHFFLSDRGSARGLFGDAILEFRDPVHIADVRIETRVVPEKVFIADVLVTNGTGRAVETTIAATIPARQLRESLQTVGPAEGVVASAAVALKPGEAKIVRLEAPWERAKLWNPDEPNLYFAEFRLGERDATRIRFGFRHFEISGHRFVLNGHSFIARSGWGGGSSHAERVTTLRRMKSRGVNACRVFIREPSFGPEIDTCDEEGVFVSTCVESNNGGGGWAERQNPHFWGEYRRNALDMVRGWRNHPSVIVWGLGCEFGAIYAGEGTWRELSVSTNICNTGDAVISLDPTRTWAEYGGVEVGCPVKGSGRCPTRSFHYPFGLAGIGHELPDVAYWYPDGKVSWHRIADFMKPTLIPEDLYHGMMDSHTAMTKWAGDSIYTPEGYLAACRYAFSMFAEGYYAGGLALWEPWMTWAGDATNRFFEDGWQVMPDFLVAIRPFGPNLKGGETDIRSLYVYNQRFTRRTCELRRTDTLGGKTISSTTARLSLDPGEKHESMIEINAPAVTAPMPLTVSLALYDAAARTNLATRSWTFTVFPAETIIAVAGNIALLAPSNSPLARIAFPAGRHDTADAALRSGAKAIVAARSLTIAEGKQLNGFVQAGGRVLALDLPPNSWTPLVYQTKKPATFAWRRNFAAMPGVDEAWLRSWRPDGIVGESSLKKSGIEDMSVILDSGQADGLSSIHVAWIYRDKGAWLICQLPLLARFDVEPCAPTIVAAILRELAAPGAKPPTTTFATAFCDEVCTNAFVDPTASPDAPKPHDLWKAPFRTVTSKGPAYNLLFEKAGILRETRQPEQAGVLFVDASFGLTPDRIATIEAAAARGAKVFVSELPPDADTNALARFGVRLANPHIPETHNGVAVPDRAPHTRGVYPHWVVPVREAGILNGLSTDDFVWYPSDKIWEWGRTLVNNTFWPIREPYDSSVVTAVIEPLAGSKARLLTTPAAIAEVPFGKGTVFLSTLRFRPFSETYARRVEFTLRTLLVNLGAGTSVSGKVYESECLDISTACNRNLWNDPARRRDDGTFDPPGWFDSPDVSEGNQNDMRYFPVNLCGWSTTANNYCPKGVFPTDPIDLGGKKFKIVDPATHDGKAVLVLANGDSATITLPKPARFEHVFFLGASQQWEGRLDVAFDGAPAPETYTTQEHFNGFRYASTKTKGVTAWVGETPKDATAGLWFWLVPNPHPGKPVSTITLHNVTGKDNHGIAILAITAEHEAK